MSNLEYEPEPQNTLPLPSSFIAPSEEEWQLLLGGMEAGFEEVTTHPEVAQARVAVARMAQEGPQYGRGFITTLYALASPVFAIMALRSFFGGDFGWFLLNAFVVATAAKLYQTTGQNEQMRSALNVREATPKWVGSLAEALEWPAKRAREIAKHLLTLHLPHLTPEDWELVTPSQRVLLYRRLEAKHIKHDSDLMLSLIHSISTARDTDALPYIERLTNIRAWTTQSGRVRAAARMCQAVLEEAEHSEAARLSQEAMEKAAEEERRAYINEYGFQQETPSPTAITPEAGTDAVAKSEETVDTPKTQAVTVPKEEAVPPELEHLIQSIREQTEKAMQPGMRLPYLFASWCVIVPYTATQAFMSLSAKSPLWAGVWLFLTVVGSQLHRITLLPWRSDEMKQLAKYDSIRGVGFLAEVLEWPDVSTQAAASDALVRLLPRLKSSDSPLLNERQRACLYRRLRLSNYKETPLILAILKSMEQVGDFAAVGYVKKLSESRAITASQKRIVKAAQDCLPYLQKRADLNQSSQFLLRAAHSVEVAPEQLLRPAMDVKENPKLLLRPMGDLEE